ncbi:peptidase 1 [Pluteus cervinus]|uniref:Peptidase 1 n=1 Tax=Pluteus cervinus TaxID=181527 RepID=A0ACD3B8P0_9AGAR|nr:peptidase 1 [Pluteus cervinus]
MHYSKCFLVLFVSLGICHGLTNTKRTQLERYLGDKVPGKYVVQLKQNTSFGSQFKNLNLNITHDWSASSGFNGFAGYFNSDALRKLLQLPDVEAIAEDGLMYSQSAQATTQTNAPWGLARLSTSSRLSNQNSSASTFSYSYNQPAGAGVDIYVLDTGVYVQQTEFGGRARWGATFGGYANADGNGHGTHCAGTAAGTTFGVAKLSNVIAIKILSDAGSGSISDIISGINWVISSARASGRPSVILMALGGSASTPMDSAIVAATNAGIHVVVPSGNSNTNAGDTSPARVPSAITVAPITIGDALSSGSNYGSVIDIFAPGTNIQSAWIGSSTATNVLSGGSMAAAHVAGLVAYLLSINGPMTPSALEALLKQLCRKDIISGVPAGTLNCLAQNDVAVGRL